MIIVLRGHIRQSFKNELLYRFIKYICLHYDNVEIYIHTWNIVQNGLSWRKIEMIHSEVNEQTIMNYFKDMNVFIKKILIEDDNNIKLNGNIKGYIPGTEAPILGWKNYWYSKYQIMKQIKEENEETVGNKEQHNLINMRFDLFNNSNIFSLEKLITFMNTCNNEVLSENKFLKNEFFAGCDNLYIGNMDTMYRLIYHFHFHLDSIIKKHGSIKYQEALVMIENAQLFDSDTKITKTDIRNYEKKQKYNFNFINYSLNKVK
jgi:hypothetical protein